MTVDDWRVKYEILNAEAEKLRAEVERLRAEEDVEKYRTTREEKINSGRYYRAQAAALLAGAEALEQLDAMESASSTMLPKSDSASEENT